MVSGRTWDQWCFPKCCFASSSPHPVIGVQCFKFDATDNLCNVMNLTNVASPPSFAHASVVTVTAAGGTAICEIVRDQCRGHRKGEIDVQDANLSEHFSPRNASSDICENTFTHTPRCVSFREDELALVETECFRCRGKALYARVPDSERHVVQKPS